MENVLNRGLNFCVLPLRLDLTQVLVDFSRFERTMIWKEFWFNRDTENNNHVPIFKSNKTNLPRNYKTPNGLKMCLSAMRSEILDPFNRNKASSNLPAEELQALKQLIQFQKERLIVIKPCDKGAGLIIINFQDYLNSCIDHLSSEQNGDNGVKNKFYQKVQLSVLDIAKTKIGLVLEEGNDNRWISKEEYLAMCPKDKNAAKFYCTFKVHK